MKECCVIIDGFALTYRAYFGLPNSIRTIKGTAINAVLGFYNTLTSLINQIQPEYLVVASDHPQPTFRHKMYPKYKANRPPMPKELELQLPMIESVLAACEIPILQLPGYEADDVIGTITNSLPDNIEAYIITIDRDILQLVNEQVSVLIPNSQKNKIYTPDIVRYEWHVDPELIPDLKALMGDASDNIPGIKLVGPKTAVKWLTKYGNLKNILESAKELPGKAGANLRKQRSKAVLYQDLTTIRVNAPIMWCWQSLRLINDFSPLRDTLAELGINAKLPQPNNISNI